jgi:signal transduction histidine kinase
VASRRCAREGLYEGFEELAQHVFERYHVRVQLDLELPEEAEGIDENCASNIYRIAQEGVLNAARHGRATHIALLLRVGGGVAELVVSDDGRGFDPQKVGRGGMGLRVMRFRAQMLGGYLSVESVPGGGTTLRCRCPLSPEREVA